MRLHSTNNSHKTIDSVFIDLNSPDSTVTQTYPQNAFTAEIRELPLQTVLVHMKYPKVCLVK